MRSMGTPRVNGWIPESTQINWCLAGRRHISCHCETSAHTGLAMTGYLEQSAKHQFAEQLMKADNLIADLSVR